MNHSLTRLSGRWLRIAKLAWVLVSLMAAGKVAIGLPLFYEAKTSICTLSAEVCSQGESLSLGQLRELESSGVTLRTYAIGMTAWRAINLVIWGGIGLLIFLRRSDDWLALIASAMMVLYTSGGYDTLIVNTYPGWAVFSEMIFNLQNILLFLFIALFPNGRFAPSWIRWYWLGMVAISLRPSSTWNIPAETENMLLIVFWISFLILGPYSQIYRFKKISTPLERQQTKWVVLGFALMAGAILFLFIFQGMSPDDSSFEKNLIQDIWFDAAGLLIPISIGFSVLRYRLWDIDLIIRRALIYGALTASLGLVYAGSVVILQQVFRSLTGSVNQSQLAIVVSTLGVAALFNPLRKRVQERIDQRFFRQKYDAERILASFAESARQQTDLDALTGQLVEAVQTSLQPEVVSLWLKEKGKEGVR